MVDLNGILAMNSIPNAPSCCSAQKWKMTEGSMTGGPFALRTKAQETVVDTVRLWNPMCFDALGAGAAYDDLLSNAIGNAVPGKGKACGVAYCPYDRPLCDAEGECVKATCAGVAQFCHEPSQVGTVR